MEITKPIHLNLISILISFFFHRVNVIIFVGPFEIYRYASFICGYST